MNRLTPEGVSFPGPVHLVGRVGAVPAHHDGLMRSLTNPLGLLPLTGMPRSDPLPGRRRSRRPLVRRRHHIAHRRRSLPIHCRRGYPRRNSHLCDHGVGLGRTPDSGNLPNINYGLGPCGGLDPAPHRGRIDDVLISAEGTGSYGALLAERLAQIGHRVVEAPTPSNKRLRGKGKTNVLDAITAARSTLVMDLAKLRDRRADQVQTALKRVHDLGLDARKARTAAQIRTIGARRQRDEALGVAVARSEAARLANQIIGLDRDLKANEIQISKLTIEHAPSLLAMHCVGAITSAIIMTVWSHPGRIRSEAARIAGTCPIPTSPGSAVRHRLNCGGDRRLNRAIISIALTRMHRQRHPSMHRTSNCRGRSKREIMRSLERYITRQIHRTLATNPPYRKLDKHRSICVL